MLITEGDLCETYFNCSRYCMKQTLSSTFSVTPLHCQQPTLRFVFVLLFKNINQNTFLLHRYVQILDFSLNSYSSHQPGFSSMVLNESVLSLNTSELKQFLQYFPKVIKYRLPHPHSQNICECKQVFYVHGTDAIFPTKNPKQAEVSQ